MTDAGTLIWHEAVFRAEERLLAGQTLEQRFGEDTVKRVREISYEDLKEARNG